MEGGPLVRRVGTAGGANILPFTNGAVKVGEMNKVHVDGETQRLRSTSSFRVKKRR